MSKKFPSFAARAKRAWSQYTRLLFQTNFIRNNAQQDNWLLKLKAKVINQPIRYLAIGDSLASGFNANLGGIDVLGELHRDTHKISGWSYPAFLAHYLQQYYQLAYFENYGHSSSKIVDWLYFLGVPLPEYNKTTSLASLRKIQQHNYNSNNPYNDLIFRHFNNFPSPSDHLIQAIKTSNLLTISLSANDFLSEINEIFQKTPQVLNNKSNLLERIDLISNKISTCYQLLIEKIVSINPDINIVLVSYPMPLLRFGPLLNQYLANLLTIPSFLGNIPASNLTDLLLNVLNHKIIRKTALATNVQYLNCYQRGFWNQRARFLVNNPFDIHPTECGYYYIAVQLLNKLSFSNEQLVGGYLSKTWLKLFNKDLVQPILPSHQLTAQEVHQIQALLHSNCVVNFTNPLVNEDLTRLLPEVDQAFSIKKLINNSKVLDWSINYLWKQKEHDDNFWFLINRDRETNLTSLIKLILKTDLNLFSRRFQDLINHSHSGINFNLINHHNLLLAILSAAGFCNSWYWWNYLLTINDNQLPKISQLFLAEKNTRYQIIKLIHDLFVLNSRLVHSIIITNLSPLKNLKLADLTVFLQQLLKDHDYQVIFKIIINDLIINFKKYQHIPTAQGLLHHLIMNHKIVIVNQLQKILK